MRDKLSEAVHIFVTPRTKQRLVEVCNDTGDTISTYVRRAIMAELKEEEERSVSAHLENTKATVEPAHEMPDA